MVLSLWQWSLASCTDFNRPTHGKSPTFTMVVYSCYLQKLLEALTKHQERNFPSSYLRDRLVGLPVDPLISWYPHKNIALIQSKGCSRPQLWKCEWNEICEHNNNNWARRTLRLNDFYIFTLTRQIYSLGIRLSSRNLYQDKVMSGYVLVREVLLWKCILRTVFTHS